MKSPHEEGSEVQRCLSHLRGASGMLVRVYRCEVHGRAHGLSRPTFCSSSSLDETRATYQSFAAMSSSKKGCRACRIQSAESLALESSAGEQ